jgi:hypothetical protein
MCWIPRMRQFLLKVLRGHALRRLSLRQIRLSTGLVLFAYVTTHFLNHTLGNISIAAMEDGLGHKLIKGIPLASEM